MSCGYVILLKVVPCPFSPVSIAGKMDEAGDLGPRPSRRRERVQPGYKWRQGLDSN